MSDPEKRNGEGPNTGVIVKAKPKTKKPSMYKVLMSNDDYTPMEFVVHVLERFFNKGREEATRMLRLLSGRSHRVLTAVAVAFEERFQMAVSESVVVFEALDEARIRAYVESGESFDKAGGYGIQGRAGAFVARLEGSYSGVMGLPLRETAQLLRKFGIVVP